MGKQLTVLFWGFIYGEVIGYIIGGLIGINCLNYFISDKKASK